MGYPWSMIWLQRAWVGRAVGVHSRIEIRFERPWWERDWGPRSWAVTELDGRIIIWCADPLAAVEALASACHPATASIYS